MDQETGETTNVLAFDYTNLMGEGRVTDKEIDDIMDRIQRAHNEIQKMRDTGDVDKHFDKNGKPEKVLFTQLPYLGKNPKLNTEESIKRLIEWGNSLKEDIDTVISFGIGGSYLGNKVIFDVQAGEFWNEMNNQERDNRPRYYFAGNNIDPRRLRQLIERVSLRSEKVLLQIISKSGSTLESMASLFAAGQMLEKEGKEIAVVAVTDPTTPEEAARAGKEETLLHKFAREQHWRTFSVPDGVGGRYTVFSEVGLVTGTVLGFDIREFLAGAREMDEATQSGDPYENMALLNAVLKYLAYKNHGRNIEVFMPYADSLKSMAEWYIQLLAESLGKKYDRDGNVVYYGRTPVVAVGTTDMHAQVQQHQEGELNKVVQFVEIDDWGEDDIEVGIEPGFEEVTGFPMSVAIKAAREANAEAQASEGRFNATFILPKLEAYYLGQIMYLLALSVAYEGALANVDAFNQPGVDIYKKILKEKLGKYKSGT